MRATLINKTGTRANIQILADRIVFAQFLDSIFAHWLDTPDWQSITRGNDFLMHRTCCFTSETYNLSIFFSQPDIAKNQISICDTFDISTTPEQYADFSLFICDLFSSYLKDKIEYFKAPGANPNAC
ncbi:MAG: hypothetical protein GY757_08845 [bacterium]|nr:hypothetical protein [bacterium]